GDVARCEVGFGESPRDRNGARPYVRRGPLLAQALGVEGLDGLAVPYGTIVGQAKDGFDMIAAFLPIVRREGLADESVARENDAQGAIVPTMAGTGAG